MDIFKNSQPLREITLRSLFHGVKYDFGNKAWVILEAMRNLNFIFALIATAIFAEPLSACPSCKDSLHDNCVATGYAISIIFMMAMPFLIMAFWAVVVYRLRKQLQRA